MLGRKVAAGGALMVSARLITRFIDLIAMLFLARILAPADFGLVAIAASVVSITEATLEIPVNQALVRLPVITRCQYDTAFTLSLIRGLILTALLPLAAVPFSYFYGEPRLVTLICVLSLAPAARGLMSPRLAEFQKEMSFWRDFALELAGKVASFGASITIALVTGSYWSIAVGTIILPIISSAGSYILAPYRPRLSLAELPIFKGFVGWMSAAQIISALNWQFERLLLGKTETTARVGLFSASSDVAGIPYLAFFGPILRPLLAGFSKISTDRDRLAESYLTSLGVVGAIGFPLLVGESLVAEPAVRLILGPQWASAAPLVAWLSLSLIPALLALPAVPLVMCFGQTRLLIYRNLIEVMVKIPLAIIGLLSFGLGGIIAARFLSELAAGAYSMLLVKRLTGISAARQLKVSWRSGLACCVMVPPVLLVRHMLSAPTGALDAALSLVTLGIVGCVVYVFSIWAVWCLCGRPPGAEEAAHRMGTDLAKGLWRRARAVGGDGRRLKV